MTDGQRTTRRRPSVRERKSRRRQQLPAGRRGQQSQTQDNLDRPTSRIWTRSQNFKMITNNASAEFGNFQGGIINVVIKSGTNQFHGNVFEYFRNDKLNANNWGNNWNRPADPAPAAPLEPVRRHFRRSGDQEQAVLLCRLPGLAQRTPATPTTFSVLPAEFRRGDFSQLLSAANGNSSSTTRSRSTPQETARRFRTTRFPTSLFNPAVRNLFADQSLYPLPSAVRAALQPLRLLPARAPVVRPGRHQAGLESPAQGRLLGPLFQRPPGQSGDVKPFRSSTTASSSRRSRTASSTGRAPSAALCERSPLRRQQLMLTMAARTRVWATSPEDRDCERRRRVLSSAGIRLTQQFGSANIGTQQLFATTTYHYADNLTMIHGRHMMKTGAQYDAPQMNVFYSGNNGRTRVP